MKHCCGEGELRAWIDRELPAGQAAAVERHIGECVRCAAALQAVEARAARVSTWMAGLSADIPLRPEAPRRASMSRGAWALVAAAAAVLVVALAMSRHSGTVPAKVALRPPPALANVEISAPPLSGTAIPVAMPRARRTAGRSARPSKVQYYMALDEEPIDTGLVMRVALPGGLQADVIVDGDGRARAIRPIQTVAKEYEP